MGGLSNGSIPYTARPSVPPKMGVEKSAFHIAATRTEIDENVNSAYSVRHFLALNLSVEQKFANPQNE